MMKKLTNSSLAAFGFAVLLLTGACATQGGGDPAMNPTVSADARDEADVDASENLIAGGAPLNTTTETVVTTNTSQASSSVDQSLSVDTNQSMTSSSNLDTQSTTNTNTTGTSGTMADDDTTTATESRTRMRKD